MAKEFENTSSTNVSTFIKGLVKDFDETYHPDGSWSHARNAVNNSVEGDLGVLGNEPSNYLCSNAPYTIIGAIHLFSTFWVIYSTDNTNSEIGLYDEKLCSYRTIVNDPCLGFSNLNLITGVSKERFDCSWQVYWGDGLNPDYTLNIGDPKLWPDVPYIGNNFYQNSTLWPGVPWVENCVTVNDCTTCTNQNQLNCEKIRLSALVQTPCINVKLGATGGNLYNGSYFAVIGYTVNGQRVGDYFGPSNTQPIFNHSNAAGALEINFSNLEIDNFQEFELVVVSIINQQTTARRIGLYSTRTNTVNIDNIDLSLPSVPIEFIPLRSPAYEKSDAIYQNGGYMIRVGPTTKYDFNYQPLANQINTKWVISRYPADYYRKGGYVAGYMRDEVYALWIRWIYNTGEKSSSYHIPGTHVNQYPVNSNNPYALNVDPIGSSYVEDYFDPSTPAKFFETINNAFVTSTLPLTPTEDGGEAVATGVPGYWESTERYPDLQPEIWNSTYDPLFSGTTNPDYDLCGKPIRHHKMPEDVIGGSSIYSRATATGANPAQFINIVGLEFSNIKPPVYRDENGNLKVVPGIVGYEILRGSREGNKSIIAKGIINNMKTYTVPGDVNGTPGLYQNYPYNPLHSSYPDTTLALSPVAPNGMGATLVNSTQVKRDFFTFHSPDTNFSNPFLAVKELRLYTQLGYKNNVTGNFEEVPGHPKHKLLTDLALITSSLIGMANAALALKGNQESYADFPRVLQVGLNAQVYGSYSDLFNTSALSISGIDGTLNAGNFFSDLLGGDLAQAVTGLFNPTQTIYSSASSVDNSRQIIGRGKGLTHTYSAFDGLPTVIKAAGGIVTFLNYWSSGTEAAIELVRATVPYRQYAYRYISHGYLHKDITGNTTTAIGNKRRAIIDSGYLDNQLQDFAGRKVNNLYRNRAVILQTNKTITDPSLPDNTVTSIGAASSQGITNAPSYSDPKRVFKTTASCFYTGLKIRYRNQYGQLDGVRQIPIPCPQIVNNNDPIPDTAITVTPGATIFNTTYTSSVLFGGDTYISRYTEKNTFLYFYDWLYEQPDGTEFDYRLRYLGLYPRFWADFTKYDPSGLINSVLTNLTNPGNWTVPSNLNNLDDAPSNNMLLNSASDFSDAFNFRFGKKDAYFYLFQSGIRDFYVESEINVEFRDWEDEKSKRFYDAKRFTNLRELFDTDIIKVGNYYKYDYSLSVSRLFPNLVSWGSVQPRDYNPMVSALCYQYQPNRVIYSLQDNLEQKKDFWRVFLTNNYKDFKSRVTCIKPISKNGALIMFENESPVQFQGTDQLQTELNTKLTIGDGGLFSQPLQNIVNSDSPYEYGSCQNRLSVINTPVGIYWMSQNQGKVFSISDGVSAISSSGMNWWFSKFLPYRIIEDFPGFTLLDNPIVGVGCQAIYDNEDQLLYFCKKDYSLKPNLPVTLTYIKDNLFTINGGPPILLGDPRYFDDASWTISYDPKSKAWVSFHDWKPDLLLPTKRNFISTKGNQLWRHNDSTSSFCNFYGIDYPFEIDYPVQTGQQVNTIRNLEYILECYKYDVEGIDRFHILDANFDHLVIYNTEQVSGLLNLVNTPKNNPFARLNYPIINPSSISVLFDKEEQKYRINQFWDITKDRGEFNTFSQQPIWLTAWDGYTRTLNPTNLDYNKAQLERKKFRHYMSNVLFIKSMSGDQKMLLKLSDSKLLQSPR